MPGQRCSMNTPEREAASPAATSPRESMGPRLTPAVEDVLHPACEFRMPLPEAGSEQRDALD